MILDGKHNFLKIGPPRVNYAGPYDLGSITHYSAFAFGRKDGLRTIFPNDKVKGKKMGQRNQMSQVKVVLHRVRPTRGRTTRGIYPSL